MKKLFMVSAALLAAFSLAACGAGSGNAPSSTAAQADSAQGAAEEEEEKQEADESEKSSEEDASSQKSERGGSASSETIEETVLLDEAGIVITAKSLDKSGFLGPELKLMIENQSGEDLTFQCRDVSVNGYMVDTTMSADVADGKKANDDITFLSSSLQTCGIETIADMEFSFHIFKTGDWVSSFLDTEPIAIKTSAADSYAYSYDDSGELVYEGNDLKIVVKGVSEDASILGSSILVYVENTGSRDVTVQAREVSLNGFMIDPIFSCDVSAGKHAIDDITFMKSSLEENNITDIEEVELSFHVFDAKNVLDTIADTDTITLRF